MSGQKIGTRTHGGREKEREGENGGARKLVTASRMQREHEMVVHAIYRL